MSLLPCCCSCCSCWTQLITDAGHWKVMSFYITTLTFNVDDALVCKYPLLMGNWSRLLEYDCFSTEGHKTAKRFVQLARCKSHAHNLRKVMPAMKDSFNSYCHVQLLWVRPSVTVSELYHRTSNSVRGRLAIAEGHTLQMDFKSISWEVRVKLSLLWLSFTGHTPSCKHDDRQMMMFRTAK